MYTRFFNEITINRIDHTVTKKSSLFKDKIQDEIFWYKSIPKKINTIAPKFMNAVSDSNFNSYTLEYIDGIVLSSLLAYPEKINQFKILDKLFNIISILQSYKKYNSQSTKRYYKNYLVDRFNKIDLTESHWNDLIKKKYISINNKKYLNPLLHIDFFMNLIGEMDEIRELTTIHGDLHFGNILLDKTGKLKLIDPRGRFFERSIYGDPRYDLAKLRHSLNGNYDMILSKDYSLSFQNDTYTLTIPQKENLVSLVKEFDNKVIELGYSIKDIRTLEALFFVTMIPLHKEDTKAQKAFLLIAAQLLSTC